MQEPTRSPSIADPSLLSDRAYAALRDRLVSLEIPPGAPIDEDALTSMPPEASMRFSIAGSPDTNS